MFDYLENFDLNIFKIFRFLFLNWLLEGFLNQFTYKELPDCVLSLHLAKNIINFWVCYKIIWSYIDSLIDQIHVNILYIFLFWFFIFLCEKYCKPFIYYIYSHGTFFDIWNDDINSYIKIESIKRKWIFYVFLCNHFLIFDVCRNLFVVFKKNNIFYLLSSLWLFYRNRFRLLFTKFIPLFCILRKIKVG